MKALTLYQPWATLVAIGAKKIETRSWQTEYRGPLAIHASKTFPKWAKELIWKDPFHEALSGEAFDIKRENFHFGMILATCWLIRCERIYATNRPISQEERAFGDYSPGRYMWFLGDIKKLEYPIPAKGSMSLWEWNEK